jgi:hypothetical protein
MKYNLTKRCLEVANNALMGKPECLYQQLGEDKEDILAAISTRAEGYHRVLAKEESTI